METLARLSNRHLILSKSTPISPNRLKPPFPMLRPTKTLQFPRRKGTVSASSPFLPRIQSSLSLPTPNQIPNAHPINFLLFLSSSSHLTSPTNYSNFISKPHPSGGSSAWFRAPDSSIDGNVALLGSKSPAVTVVLLGWLGARQKHLRRYAEWYNSKGINAVTFVVDVRELIRLDWGKRVEERITAFADELVSWVSGREEDGRDRCLVFHTFSNTGFFVYGYILDIFRGREGLYLEEKIKGGIFDSGGGELLSPKAWAAGWSAALLKKWSSATQPLIEAKDIDRLENGYPEPKMQAKEPAVIETMVLAILEKLFSVIMKVPEVEQKLEKIMSVVKKPPSCPQLYLYSTADKVVPSQSIESLIENQRRMGRKVLSHDFRISPHVDHYRMFPDIYSKVLCNFLEDCFAAVKQT